VSGKVEVYVSADNEINADFSGQLVKMDTETAAISGLALLCLALPHKAGQLRAICPNVERV